MGLLMFEGEPGRLVDATLEALKSIRYSPGAPQPGPPERKARSDRTSDTRRAIELQAGHTAGRALVSLNYAEPLGQHAHESLAHALALRVAAILASPVGAFTARLVEGESDDDFDLALNHRIVSDGSAREGRLAARLVASYGEQGWADICDAKAYFAVGAIYALAASEWLGDEPAIETFVRCEPGASLGSARLDQIAQSVAFASDVSQTSVGGRPALRMTALDGSKSISVVSDQELELLREALRDPRLEST